MGGEEQILLGVNDRAGELPEEILEALALLEAEGGVVMPQREDGERFGVSPGGEHVVGVGPGRRKGRRGGATGRWRDNQRPR